MPTNQRFKPNSPNRYLTSTKAYRVSSKDHYERVQEVLNESVGAGERLWQPLPEGSYPLQRDTPTPGPHSHLEWEVAKTLRGYGYKPELYSYHVPDLVFPDSKTWKITPDITIGNTVIEVDVPKDQMGGPTHLRGFPAHDLYRTDSLRSIGVVSVRLRLFDLAPVEGAHCICRKGALTLDLYKELHDLLSTLDTTMGTEAYRPRFDWFDQARETR